MVGTGKEILLELALMRDFIQANVLGELFARAE
jgi:hypothetical protein